MFVSYTKVRGVRMYKTIKLRIRADRERKQVLLAYEDIYHSALRKYVYQMILEGKPIRYDVKRIHKAIPKESKWQLYQTARNRYAYFLKHHDWEFHKSSIWNQRNFTVSQDTLVLSFVWADGSRYRFSNRVSLITACFRRHLLSMTSTRL